MEKPFDLILFDGICNFCNSSVNFIIDRDAKQRFKFASLQSDIGQKVLKEHNLKTENFDSIILIKNGILYQKSNAALQIAKELDGYWFLFYWIFYGLPSFLRDFFYDLIAKNRYLLFGKEEACRMPNENIRNRFL